MENTLKQWDVSIPLLPSPQPHQKQFDSVLGRANTWLYSYFIQTNSYIPDFEANTISGLQLEQLGWLLEPFQWPLRRGKECFSPVHIVVASASHPGLKQHSSPFPPSRTLLWGYAHQSLFLSSASPTKALNLVGFYGAMLYGTVELNSAHKDF